MLSPPRWDKCYIYLKGEGSPDESVKMTREKMPANHLPGSESVKPPSQVGTALPTCLPPSPLNTCCLTLLPNGRGLTARGGRG